MDALHAGRFTEIFVIFTKPDFLFFYGSGTFHSFDRALAKFKEPHDLTASISQIRHDVGNRDGGGFFPSKASEQASE